MGRLLHLLPDLYHRQIMVTGKEPQFLVLAAFLVTFVVVRTGSTVMRSGGRIPFVGRITVRGKHIHHLVPGIILLLVSGYLGVAIDRSRLDLVAVLFGIGAALTLDEFALWLHLRDVYWEREGRRSVDAVVIVATILGLFVVGAPFFISIAREVTKSR